MEKEFKASIEMFAEMFNTEQASGLLDNMFPEVPQGYKKGEIMTVGELKNLPDGSVIHLYYWEEDEDEEEYVSYNDFTVFERRDGNPAHFCTKANMPIPVEEYEDEEKIENLENCDTYFTICKAEKI